MARPFSVRMALLMTAAAAGCTHEADPPEALDEAVSTLHGRSPGGPQLSRSGSRLEARFLRGPGAYTELESFWDRELGVACTFELNQNLEWECQPRGVVTNEQNGGYAFYTDPTCAEDPVVITPAGAEAPARGAYGGFIIATRPADGGEPAELSFTVEEELAPQPYYRKFRTRGCTLIGDPAPGERFFHARPIPAGTLVAGTERHDWIGGSRIRSRVIYGADGSRSAHLQNTLPFDAVLGVDVFPRPRLSRSTTDERSVWHPWLDFGGIAGDVFADDRCSKDVAWWYPTPTPSSLIATDPALTPRCDGYTSEFFHIGQTPETTLFGTAGGSCGLLTEPVEDPLYAVGAPIRRHEYATSSRVLVPVSRRFSAMYEATDDGARYATGRLYDRELDDTCQLRRAGDVYVCDPTYDWFSNTKDLGTIAYTDAACTQRVIAEPATVLAGQPCFAGRVRAFELGDDGRTVTAYRGHRKVAATAVQTYVKDGTSCTAGEVQVAYAIRSSSTHALGVARLDPAPAPARAFAAPLASPAAPSLRGRQPGAPVTLD